MQYFYADGTPFPLGRPFLAAVRRVVDTCVELLDDRWVDAHWDDATTAPLLATLERLRPLTDLPEVDESLHFAVDGRTGHLRIVERTYFGLEFTSEVAATVDTVFAGPFRVREVSEDARPIAWTPRGPFGLGRRARPIGALWVVGVDVSPGRATLSLATRPGRAPTQFLVRQGRDGGTFAREPDGTSRALAARDAEVVAGVWTRIARGMANRARRVPSALVEARIDGTIVRSIGNPAPLVARLIAAIAPLYAETLYRSGRDDVLMLNDAAGTRHVLAVADLRGLVARLPGRARDAFVPLGLAPPAPDSAVRPLPLPPADARLCG